jgi:prepilin peptidase CpaA
MLIHPYLDSVSAIPLVVVLLVGSIAAFTDLRNFTIPNLVTLPLFASGLLFHSFATGGNGFTFAFLGGLCGFMFLIQFYVLGGMGAGDVKLLAAVGAWIGPVAVFVLFLVSAFLMGIYALVLTWMQGTLRLTLLKALLTLNHGMTIVKHLGADERVEQMVQRDDRRRRLIPYAAMVLAGIGVLIGMKCLLH